MVTRALREQVSIGQHAESGPGLAPRPDMDSLLVLSDVHLGSDLNDFGHPIRRSRSVDDDLVKLITHYRAVVPPTDHWHLVVAGDFIDFVGMAVRAEGADLATERNDEEREHGLGNAVDHVRVKLRWSSSAIATCSTRLPGSWPTGTRSLSSMATTISSSIGTR